MRFLRHLLSASAGIAVAALVVFAAASLGNDDVPEEATVTVTPSESVEVETVKRRSADRLLLAWTPTGTGGLPDETKDILEDTDGVRTVTIGLASLDWLSRSTDSGGARVDDPPPGMRIPVEIAAVDPAEYAQFAPPGDRPAIAGLDAGEVLLSEASARLRGEAVSVVLESGRYSVAGVISDAAANGYEMLIRAPAPSSWDIVDRFALLDTTTERTRARVKKALKSALDPGQVLRIRAKGETPYLRYGDAVMPQSIIKENFGEFAARPRPDGTATLDDAWVEQNVVRARIPILGDAVCHRALFPQLRNALREVKRRGLSFLIDTSQFGGCYGPRFINRIPGGRLSHHAWGIALDINAADNAYGTRPDLDRRLVEIFEDFGFTWGGRWLVPDGMHFEWVRFP